MVATSDGPAGSSRVRGGRNLRVLGWPACDRIARGGNSYCVGRGYRVTIIVMLWKDTPGGLHNGFAVCRLLVGSGRSIGR